MNSIRYPKYIYSISIILIIFVVIYYVYQNLNKIMEGATTGESDNISTSPIDATDTLKMQIKEFTQSIYDTTKSYLTSKTKDSEIISDELIKKMDEKHKNIELLPEIDPDIKKKLEDLNNLLIINANKLKIRLNGSSNTGVSVKILPKDRTKIRDIVNTYL